ncbi:hypothetical protein [Streptosporangium oxazolinicum]
MGRGGELSEFAPDVPPLNLPQAGQLGAVDFMALQLPVSLVGYNTQSVDETLNRVAGALSERDTRIAVLEQRVSELLAGRLQARHELNPGSQPPARRPEAPYELSGGDGFGASEELSSGSPVVSRTERETPPGSSDSSGGDGVEASEELSGEWRAKPATPSTSAEPAKPSEPAELSEPADPSVSAGSSEAAKPFAPAEPTAPAEPAKSFEPEELPRVAEASEKSGVSRFARPSEPSQVPDSSSQPSSSGVSESKESKESSPGSVGLRTGERQETEDPR